MRVRWSLIGADGASYARESLTLTAENANVDVRDVRLIDLPIGGASVAGTVPGSPIEAGSFVLGLEHPMSSSEVRAGRAICHIKRALPLSEGASVTYTAVIDAAPKGQTRRSFLAYLERQRPRPYSPFLHYNSWYDLGYFNKYTAPECVERINEFGQHLSRERGVKLSSFLFDDGWDDTSTVWNFNSGFPNGFSPLKAAAAQYGAGPGIWLSPWGGYGTPREQRLATGKKLGYEIDSEGYALSGPKYYARFHDVCMKMVRDYGINQFKFDGTGSPDKQYPGSKFSSDFEAAIQLISDLRRAKPGLFINLTTGTWPSPFWTRYADSIWRGGSDHEFAGVGPWREKWITYRDGDTYHGVVKKGPLYPLNSLMLHGIIFARYAAHLGDDPGHDFRNEVRDYFAGGTQLQEMYITPTLLSKQNWDDLAESARWSQADSATLKDTHWVGGDPMNLEVYGWAAWSAKKAILTLRNPSDKPQSFSIDAARVFELPAGSRGSFIMRSPYKSDAGKGALALPVGRSRVVMLQPFQVMTIEGASR